MNHILSCKQYTNRRDLSRIFFQANSLRSSGISQSLTGRILATLFYEPSTRTRLSFESAMIKMGGSVISTENALQFSSAVKGESLEDTIKIVSSYADCIVLRHFNQGSAEIASKVSNVPVVNAGDGSGEHPTQALLDIYTIVRERQAPPDCITIALVGDLLYGRTVHSLIYLLGLYQDVKIYAVSPPELQLPKEIINFMQEREMTFEVVSSLEYAIEKNPDVVYMTRVQAERLQSAIDRKTTTDSDELRHLGKEKHDVLDYSDRIACQYQLSPYLASKLNENAIIMHPLPRRDELPKEIDNLKQSVYFKQAENGLWLRASLLCNVIGPR